MSPVARAIAALVLLLVPGPAFGIAIFVHSPKQGQAVFGEVEVRIELLASEPVSSVEIRLDGTLVARMQKPPWVTTIDVGHENVAHTLEITAVDSLGQKESRTISTGMIPIDDKVKLELQQLYVTVTEGGKRITGLPESAFTAFDRGVVQKTVTFEGGDVPLTASLLIDSSLSMEGEALESALAGARAFIEGLGPLDEASLMVFSDRLLARTDFDSDPKLITEVMNSVEPTGSTSINDHLYLALQELDARQGRRVVILLSDGIDVDSVLDMSEVEWKAGHVQSVLYWIRPSSGGDLAQMRASVWRDATAQHEEATALARAVEGSGGKVHVIESIDHAAEAFREILQELRDQYVIGYYPTVDLDDGSWHSVLVQVIDPTVEVRVRGGYYDDAF
jgi:Ca-activated chloride channel family protein